MATRGSDIMWTRRPETGDFLFLALPENLLNVMLVHVSMILRFYFVLSAINLEKKEINCYVEFTKCCRPATFVKYLKKKSLLSQNCEHLMLWNFHQSHISQKTMLYLLFKEVISCLVIIFVLGSILLSYVPFV